MQGEEKKIPVQYLTEIRKKNQGVKKSTHVTQRNYCNTNNEITEIEILIERLKGKAETFLKKHCNLEYKFIEIENRMMVIRGQGKGKKGVVV